MDTPKMHIVNSSNIKRAGYDKETKKLYVEFNNKKKYIYKDVPGYIYKGIFEADSPGAFFHKYVIGGQYKFEQLKEKEDENNQAVVK